MTKDIYLRLSLGSETNQANQEQVSWTNLKVSFLTAKIFLLFLDNPQQKLGLMCHCIYGDAVWKRSRAIEPGLRGQGDFTEVDRDVKMWLATSFSCRKNEKKHSSNLIVAWEPMCMQACVYERESVCIWDGKRELKERDGKKERKREKVSWLFNTNDQSAATRDYLFSFYIEFHYFQEYLLKKHFRFTNKLNWLLKSIRHVGLHHIK